MSAVIHASGLSKRYGAKAALDGVNLDIQPGRIVGLIGPNGAGKTTALKAMLGLTPFEGTLEVMGRDPFRQRHELMHDVCFIADVAVLPRWIQVGQVIDYVAAVHPRFDRAHCEGVLAKTQISMRQRVRELSKGMVVQLHLALVMAIDARLLVLDEPTLGLDILYRKRFYEQLLNDYFDGERTILITTHQVEEIEHLLTDLIFIKDGKVVLDTSMEDVAARYHQVLVPADRMEAARALKPLTERRQLGRTVCLFGDKSEAQLADLGEIHPVSVADLFVAYMEGGQA
ncbi:MAG: ABC transporter ATP-binding protein [Xanthomonadales bacterium]|nr:ABC transporter ATP-binding protein [Xanthomonadales bacterium]